MRIRKRHVLLSSQHFPATPPSDPHLNNRSPVVVQLGDATPTASEPSSSKQQRSSAVLSLDRNQPIPPINSSDHPSGRRQHCKQDPSAEDGGGREEEEESGGGDSEEKKGNHSRKGRIFGSSQTLPPPLSPSSTPQDNGRWCEEEKAIPFKKRRGAFETNGAVNINDNTSCIGQLGTTSGSKKAKMKTKMNKKCSSSSVQNHDDEDDKKKVVREAKPHGGGGGKKRGRGSALMEGSRCSRVNGRGWRCLQQTLVGYSLCEHHLGKGRLRSMTSVRSRSTFATTTTTDNNTTSSSSTATAPSNKVVVVVQQDHHKLLPSYHHDGETNLSLLSSSPDEKQIDKCVAAADSDDDDDEKKPVVIMTTAKKRMKLGTVKARSMSSLLGQTNTITTGIAFAHESNTNK